MVRGKNEISETYQQTFAKKDNQQQNNKRNRPDYQISQHGLTGLLFFKPTTWLHASDPKYSLSSEIDTYDIDR